MFLKVRARKDVELEGINLPVVSAIEKINLEGEKEYINVYGEMCMSSSYESLRKALERGVDEYKAIVPKFIDINEEYEEYCDCVVEVDDEEGDMLLDWFLSKKIITFPIG